MSTNSSATPLSPQKQSALLRILRATTTLPAQLTFYASALGAIALIGGANLPAGLAMLAGGVGVNALSSILERVARGEEVSDSEILEQLKAAIEESHIAEQLAVRDTQIMIARLFRQHDLLKYAIQNHEYVVLQRLTEQAQSYEAFVTELRDDISALYVLSSSIYVELQASDRKNDEILNVVREMRDQLASMRSVTTITPRPGSAPPLPALVVGREDDLRNLKARLGLSGEASLQVLTAIRGWPGIGKTTIAAVLAHDPDITAAFPDGVLWTSLGQTPNLFSELATWGRALGTDDLLRAKTLEEAAAQLTAMLRNKRMLLIIDDVWELEHAVPFKVGGRGCATLITTRVTTVAEALAPTPDAIYRLPVLTFDKALELLTVLAPSVVAQNRKQCLELVQELEGLPLALQVAGRMLHVEESRGFGVKELITELREGVKLLKAKAPSDRVDFVKAPADQVNITEETIPTVTVLLQRSTDRLDEQTRDCYAYLGVFAPKPATFDLDAMKAVWQVEQPEPIVRTLVDRGLLEFVKEMGRYQMHALLVGHAKSLLTEE